MVKFLVSKQNLLNSQVCQAKPAIPQFAQQNLLGPTFKREYYLLWLYISKKNFTNQISWFYTTVVPKISTKFIVIYIVQFFGSPVKFAKRVIAGFAFTPLIYTYSLKLL